MDKSREELEKEHAEATPLSWSSTSTEAKGMRNFIRYYTQGERKKRNHRLITRGGAVGKSRPGGARHERKGLFSFDGKGLFSLPEVAALVSQATDQQESG